MYVNKDIHGIVTCKKKRQDLLWIFEFEQWRSTSMDAIQDYLTSDTPLLMVGAIF